MVTDDEANPTPIKSALHLWQKVTLSIEKDILQRRLSPGDRLPSEEELAKHLDVHRNTVRRALEVLEEKGLVRIEHGHGSFVQERVISHPLSSRKSLPLILKGLDRVGREDVLESATIRPTKEITAALKLSKAQYVRRVDLRTVVDNNPIMVSSVYFPLPRFHGIDQAIAETQSVPDGLKRLGVDDFIRYESRITTGQASRSDATLLAQSRSQPVLQVKNIITDGARRPILFSVIRMSARWIELVVRYNDM